MEETSPITFEKDDRLGLKPFSEKLEKFLMVENDFVEGSLVNRREIYKKPLN